jgi:hypothetical protein
VSVIGYARAGDAQAQMEALAAAGAEQVFPDRGRPPGSPIVLPGASVSTPWAQVTRS